MSPKKRIVITKITEIKPVIAKKNLDTLKRNLKNFNNIHKIITLNKAKDY